MMLMCAPTSLHLGACMELMQGGAVDIETHKHSSPICWRVKTAAKHTRTVSGCMASCPLSLLSSRSLSRPGPRGAFECALSICVCFFLFEFLFAFPVPQRKHAPLLVQTDTEKTQTHKHTRAHAPKKNTHEQIRCGGSCSIRQSTRHAQVDWHDRGSSVFAVSRSEKPYNRFFFTRSATCSRPLQMVTSNSQICIGLYRWYCDDQDHFSVCLVCAFVYFFCVYVGCGNTSKMGVLCYTLEGEGVRMKLQDRERFFAAN